MECIAEALHCHIQLRWINVLGFICWSKSTCVLQKQSHSSLGPQLLSKGLHPPRYSCLASPHIRHHGPSQPALLCQWFSFMPKDNVLNPVIPEITYHSTTLATTTSYTQRSVQQVFMSLLLEYLASCFSTSIWVDFALLTSSLSTYVLSSSCSGSLRTRPNCTNFSRTLAATMTFSST